MKKSRVFVIGLDGGSWNVIDPIIERGYLPNLARLKGESAWGTLRSTFPPVTCPAWFTFSTGIRPNRLGMYEFRGIPKAMNHVVFYSYRNLGKTEFWDLLMRQGYSCGIVNDPLVYPLKDHLGYIVPGFITPQEELRTFPESLGDELDKEMGGFEIETPAGFVVDDETLLKGCSRVNGKLTRAISYLLDRYPTDFFLGVYTSTDRICHRFLTRALLGEDDERETGWRAISKIYSEVDEGIGHILDRMHEDDFLMIMSDHGFAARPWNIHLNQWLLDEGLLSVKVTGGLEKLGLTQRRIAKPLYKLGIADHILRMVPQRLRRLFPTGESIFGEFFIHELIESGRLDWSGTQALAVGAGIYLNTSDRPQGFLSPAETEDLKVRIVEGLETLRDPDGGGGGVKVLEPAAVYGSHEIKDAPDLLVEGEGDWEVSADLSTGGGIFTPNRRSGHRQEGLFMFRHHQINMGEVEKPLGIEDLAPLILHLYGIKTPVEMDGGMRADLFTPGALLREELHEKLDIDAVTQREKALVALRIAELRRDGIL